jgi:hypothetical protein
MMGRGFVALAYGIGRDAIAMNDFIPSAEHLARRAAYYRALARTGKRRAKASEYLEIAAILEREAASILRERKRLGHAQRPSGAATHG